MTFDWSIAEDAYTPCVAGDALRYLDDPAKDGKSADKYLAPSELRAIAQDRPTIPASPRYSPGTDFRP